MTLLEQLEKDVYVKIAEGHSCRPLHSTTDIWARLHGDLIELRMGWSFPGNIIVHEDMNPFDPEYHDNYINGLGMTIETAWKSLEREAKLTAESYWG